VYNKCKENVSACVAYRQHYVRIYFLEIELVWFLIFSWSRVNQGIFLSSLIFP